MRVQNWTYDHAKQYIRENEEEAIRRQTVREQRRPNRKARKGNR